MLLQLIAMKPTIPTALFIAITTASGCAGDSTADPAPSEPTEQISVDTTTSTAPTASTEPAYITRAEAEREGGLRPCESPGTDISERSYTYEHALDVIRNLDLTPVVPDAEIRIGYADTVDGYVEISDVGDPDRILEIFDNYRLVPPLEMYCYLPGEAGVPVDIENGWGPSD